MIGVTFPLSCLCSVSLGKLLVFSVLAVLLHVGRTMVVLVCRVSLGEKGWAYLPPQSEVQIVTFYSVTNQILFCKQTNK